MRPEPAVFCSVRPPAVEGRIRLAPRAKKE
jgi:hypothetical protein